MGRFPTRTLRLEISKQLLILVSSCGDEFYTYNMDKVIFTGNEFGTFAKYLVQDEDYLLLFPSP